VRPTSTRAFAVNPAPVNRPSIVIVVTTPPSGGSESGCIANEPSGRRTPRYVSPWVSVSALSPASCCTMVGIGWTVTAPQLFRRSSTAVA
jgi:hypothetical protein